MRLQTGITQQLIADFTKFMEQRLMMELTKRRTLNLTRRTAFRVRL